MFKFISKRDLINLVVIPTIITISAVGIQTWFSYHFLQEQKQSDVERSLAQKQADDTKSLVALDNSAHSTVDGFMNSVDRLNLKDPNKDELYTKIRDYAVENYSKIKVQIRNSEVLTDQEKAVATNCLYNQYSLASQPNGVRNIRKIFESNASFQSNINKELFFHYAGIIPSLTKYNLSKMIQAQESNQTICITRAAIQ
jgi:hypothetical protein